MNNITKYPSANAYFKISVEGVDGQGVFTEISGAGNSAGCLSLLQGYVTGQGMKRWIDECVGGGNRWVKRYDVKIELIGHEGHSLSGGANIDKADAVWKLERAWIVKYTGNSLKDGSSECSVASMEMAYEAIDI